MGKYESLEKLLLAAAEAVRPPERLSVPAAAEKYRFINNPGSYVGPYRTERTPYIVEPLEVLTSTDYTGMVFAGPAQAAKTEMILSWLTYSAICDPADLMLIDKSQTAARDFYMRRLEKLYRDTPDLKGRLLPGQKGQSTYSSRFTNGMLFTLSWPTVNELSGKPIGRLWLADYDRMDEDVGGEGSPFDLAFQRMKSFKRQGMCAAESSPSRTIENSKWMPKSPHEAPPTTGILALYNRGDRRRWYWTCVSCNHAFEPDFTRLEWPDCEDPLEAAEQCYMSCPHCGQVYTEEPDANHGMPGKYLLNQNGIWIKDGQRLDPETGEIVGDAKRSTIASFWLKGPAAAFADWTDMVHKYLKALSELEATGSEEALKTTVNTDQGLPYLPQGIEADLLPEEVKERARDLGEKVVPEGVRFLVATVDVQPTRFEVGVHGFGEHGDAWVIDRFKIKKSERRDEEGDRLTLNTASYVEDWKLLIDQVVLKTYPLADDSGRSMQIKITGIDSGGKDGTTKTAADFWRYLRDRDGRNLHRRTYLLKGEPRDTAPLVRVDYPDAERKDRKSGLRGDVPVMFICSNKGKDMASAMLGREEPGGGYIHFPDWLPDWYYTELTAESRTTKGWLNTSKQQNESWDLLYYSLGMAHSSKVGLQRIDWSSPPGWAAEWDRNDLVFQDAEKPRFQFPPRGDIDLKSLAEKLA